MSSIITGMHYDIGGREIYEDRVDAQTLQTAGGLQLAIAIVADGVGGENKGERAAQLAKDAVFNYLRQGKETNIPTLLTQAIQYANQTIHQEVKDTGGASTTLAMAAVTPDNTLFIANVGDSRIYLCRNNKLTQLTIDHNFATIMPWQNKLSPEAARQHPRADVLMRALGPKPDVPVDTGFYVGTTDPRTAGERGQAGLPLKEGDAVLVCSDGLIKMAPQTGQPYATSEEIIQVLTTQEGEKAARSLVSFALGRNADDNVSAAVLQMPDSSRHRRALAPLYRWGAIGLVVVLVLIGLIAFWFNRQAKIEVEAIGAAATAEQVAIAATTQIEQTTATAVAQVTETAVAAQAATAAAEATAQNQVAQAAQAAAAATAEIAATAQAEAAATAAAEALCNGADLYQYEQIRGPELMPPPPVSLVRNAPNPPEFSASWQLTNTGSCDWHNVRVRSINTNQFARHELVGKTQADIVAIGETITLILHFDTPAEAAESQEDSWEIVLSVNGLELGLAETLQIGGEKWVTIKAPTAVPTPTSLPPTATPEPTTPPDTSGGNNGGGNNGGGDGGGTAPPPPPPPAP